MTSPAQPVPIATPLKTLAEVDEWSASALGSGPDPNRTSVDYNCDFNEEEEKDRVKVILAHDMRGGYLDDKYCNGTNNYAYHFNYWHLVDIFIYFSHHRVSIPPVQWVTIAHKNNVKVLLNVIVEEWDDDKIPLETLKLIYGPDYNHESPPERFSTHYADKLVDIATYYKLSGIFLNIESKLPSLRDAIQLVEFIGYLRQQVHERIHGLVIWYDAATIEGKLEWQNKVTELNFPFLNAADGIFLNYTWKEQYPEHTTQFLNSLELPSDIKSKVFFGIDFWGRNTFGGGGFCVHKALEVIKNHGFNAALFAPAFTWEKWIGQDPTETDIIRFRRRERRIWIDGQLDLNPDFVCSVDRQDQDGEPVDKHVEKANYDDSDVPYPASITTYVRPRVAGTNKGLWTDFGLGIGESWYESGKRVLQSKFCNLGLGSLCHSYHTSNGNVAVIANTLRNGSPKIEWDVTQREPIWHGSNALRVEFDDFNEQVIIARLFRCSVDIHDSVELGLRYSKIEEYEVGVYVSVARQDKLHGRGTESRSFISWDKKDDSDSWILVEGQLALDGWKILELGFAIKQKEYSMKNEVKEQIMFAGSIPRSIEGEHRNYVHVGEIYIRSCSPRLPKNDGYENQKTPMDQFMAAGRPMT